MKNNDSTSYPIPMPRTVIVGFFLAVAVVAGITAWSFSSGLTWTGICLIVVAAPMALLFWYMLYVNPSRAVILAEDDGLTISVPPFVQAVVPYANMNEVAMVDLKTDDVLAPGKPERGMKWGPYRAGTFQTTDGGEAQVATNTRRALRIRTAEHVFLIGPSGVDELESILAEKTS